MDGPLTVTCEQSDNRAFLTVSTLTRSHMLHPPAIKQIHNPGEFQLHSKWLPVGQAQK